MIRKSSTNSLAAAAVACFFSYGPAHAACDVDFGNAPARGLTASMVRMFAACPGSPHPSFPNSDTEGDVPACSPVLPREWQGSPSEYRYASDGGCQVKISSKLASDCASVRGSDGTLLGLPPGPCHVSRVTAKCKEILDGNNILIGETDSGWTLWTLMRASIDDETHGPMTVIDLPVTFEFGNSSNGAMKLHQLSAEPLQELGVFLPACTTLEILKLEVRDPLGKRFATMGVATIPED